MRKKLSPVKRRGIVRRKLLITASCLLKLDCFHLEYFTNLIHFVGHYVAITPPMVKS